MVFWWEAGGLFSAYVGSILGAIVWAVSLSAYAGTWDAPLASGTLVVATERVADARFKQTVILLSRHDDQGTVGFLLNVPSNEPGLLIGGYVDPKRRFKADVSGERGDSVVQLRFSGYCGWQPGQLAREIAAGAWRTVEVDLDWAARQPPQSLWQTLQTWWGWAWL